MKIANDQISILIKLCKLKTQKYTKIIEREKWHKRNIFFHRRYNIILLLIDNIKKDNYLDY